MLRGPHIAEMFTIRTTRGGAVYVVCVGKIKIKKKKKDLTTPGKGATWQNENILDKQL